jgi:quinol monooxygenase YgiN
MGHMLIRHKVTDFSTWKSGYEAHTEMRNKAGLHEEQLMRNANDPNEVVILFEAEDQKRAEEFSNSPELREAMVKAGVVGKPEILFLN